MAKQETWADLRRRARWDRIFGALAVLILLMILIISSCGKKDNEEIEPVNNMETLPVSTESATEEVIDHSMAVFLSPSTQTDNLYACDDITTEKEAMWMIARQVKTMLEEDGYLVYICAENATVPEKVAQGDQLQCGAYVAIHSNSSGEGIGDKGQGTECFYNTEISGSLALAENIYNRVAEVTPTPDRGVKDQNQRDLFEISKNHSPCCLLEVEFHDDVQTSRWILNHTEDLAQAITEGIEAYLEGTRYNPPAVDYDSTEPSEIEDYTGDH